MKQTKIVLALAALALSLAACGGSSSSGGGGGPGHVVTAEEQKCNDTPKEDGVDIRYFMSQNINGAACTTGCQIFHSMDSYCAGLLNDQLNNNCAKDQRNKDFQDSCPH